MSIRYNLLGIPKTLDEFVDKIKIGEQTHIDVITASYYDNYWNCYIRLQADKSQFNFKKDKWCGDFGATYNTVQRMMLEESIKVAEILQGLNFITTINGEVLNQAREKLSIYLQRERESASSENRPIETNTY
jgi:hypothetical protein